MVYTELWIFKSIHERNLQHFISQGIEPWFIASAGDLWGRRTLRTTFQQTIGNCRCTQIKCTDTNKSFSRDHWPYWQKNLENERKIYLISKCPNIYFSLYQSGFQVNFSWKNRFIWQKRFRKISSGVMSRKLF